MKTLVSDRVQVIIRPEKLAFQDAEFPSNHEKTINRVSGELLEITYHGGVSRSELVLRIRI